MAAARSRTVCRASGRAYSMSNTGRNMVTVMATQLQKRTIRAAVFCLASSLCWGACASIAERAAANIETYRKGEAVVRFQRADGSGVAGAAVKVRQLTHDFPFGNLVRPRHYENGIYLSRFKEVFNFVELLEFNWGQYEPDEGKPLLAERREFINGWCKENGITQFYGHMLVWSSQYGKYPKTALPLWLFQYDGERQYELLKGRIQREVRDYADVDIMWDVVNEATHCRVWGDWDKRSYHTEPMEDVFPYVRDALRWANEANPKAPLLINDYRVIAKTPFRERYKTLLQRLLKEGSPLSAVGIQAHEPYKGKYWYSPEELWATYELFGSELGLPIYITEFFYVSEDGKEIMGDYRKGTWNEERQAEAIEEFYRITFGHPRIKCIIYFGLSDNDVVQPKCGLLDEQYNPKPAWVRLKRLIWDEWTTEASGTTSNNGTFRFRGFFGEYEIRLTHDGKSQTFKLHLKASEPNRWVMDVK
jgi:endo-1,4-beta-xylanase